MRPLSILLESYCNFHLLLEFINRDTTFNSPRVLLQPCRGTGHRALRYSFNSPRVLLQPANISFEPALSFSLSILLESYCNLIVGALAGEAFRLSILLESYCNPADSEVLELFVRSFNSPRVLLQPEPEEPLRRSRVRPFNSPRVLLQQMKTSMRTW